MRRKLTTTSFAVLGMLSRGPRTAAELVRDMETSGLRLLWPRAQSKLYEEPKKLLDHGFASEAPGVVAGRRRSVYRITENGREALRCWLDESGAAGLLPEFEAAVKVQLADAGDRDALLRNIRAAAAATTDQYREIGEATFREYLETGPRHPERVHVTAVTFRLISDLERTVTSWCEWAQQWVSTWPDGPVKADADAVAEALAVIDEVVQRYDSNATDRRPEVHER